MYEVVGCENGPSTSTKF
jgi:hypothetical protein